MKWQGAKYDSGRPLEESIGLIRKELEAIDGLRFELSLGESPNGLSGGLIVVEVLEPHGDRVMLAKISDLVSEYNYSANEPENDVWDMGFNLRVRSKPPVTV